MTSQATSVDLDPIPPLLIGRFLLRKWRAATKEENRRRNRKTDQSSENYDVKFGVCTF